MKKQIVCALLCAALLCGCSAPVTVISGTEPEKATEAVTGTIAVEDLFSDRDYEVGYKEESSIPILLEGKTARCDSDAVRIEGGKVTVLKEGTYVVSGELDDGMIVVDADKKDKIQLVLSGADITSATSAALYILQADKVFLTLVGENSLQNGGSFVAIDDNNIDGAIFSKEDLTMNGEGSLAITSPAGHGVVSKDELTITSGTYAVNCAGHGFAGKDCVSIASGSFTVTAGKDGIHGENDDDASAGFVYVGGGDFTVSAEGDGISAGAALQIDGGSFDIVTGGGAVNGQKQTSDGWGGMGGPGGHGGGRPGGGMGGFGGQTESDTTEDSTSIKGIKAGADLLICDGSFTIDSADDAVHSNADLTVSGGSFAIATGDDGFHADGALQVLAGTISVTESYEGLEGLSITVSGGNIRLTSSDDGLNAAGGTDGSGFGGFRGGDQFGGRGGMGGMGGMGGSSDSFICISGGELYIQASGDGIDSNGTLEISGGFTIVCGPTQGDTAVLDYEISGTVTGGTFIGTGSYMMAQTFSDSQQGVIALSVGNQSAGTRITLSDGNGDLLIDRTPTLNYAIVILTTPEMAKGEQYTVTVGSLSDVFEAG